MSIWTEAELLRALELVKERASTETAFRTLALSNANAALEEVASKSFPGSNIRFIESKGSPTISGEEVVVVLPEMQESLDELSDEMLETVAGGTGGNNPPPTAPPPPIGIS
jgi:hypothetical protein